MMPPIRKLAERSTDLLDELRLALHGSAIPVEEDPSLDMLVRRAVQAPTEERADAGRIWSRLRGRVRGPFGVLALEGPGGGSATALPGPGWATQVTPQDATLPDAPAAEPSSHASVHTVRSSTVPEALLLR